MRTEIVMEYMRNYIGRRVFIRWRRPTITRYMLCIAYMEGITYTPVGNILEITRIDMISGTTHNSDIRIDTIYEISPYMEYNTSYLLDKEGIFEHLGRDDPTSTVSYQQFIRGRIVEVDESRICIRSDGHAGGYPDGEIVWIPTCLIYRYSPDITDLHQFYDYTYPGRRPT